MKFHRYSVTLKHGKGRTSYTIVSTRLTQAIRSVLNAQLAPFRSVVKFKRGKLVCDTRADPWLQPS